MSHAVRVILQAILQPLSGCCPSVYRTIRAGLVVCESSELMLQTMLIAIRVMPRHPLSCQRLLFKGKDHRRSVWVLIRATGDAFLATGSSKSHRAPWKRVNLSQRSAKRHMTSVNKCPLPSISSILERRGTFRRKGGTHGECIPMAVSAPLAINE